MEKREYLIYKENENIKFSLYESDFVTFLCSTKNNVIDNLILKKNNADILLNNVNIKDMTKPSIRREISYILNQDLNIFTSETVEDEIAFGLESLSIPRSEMKEIIHLKAREYKLEDYLKKSPYSLGISDKVKLKILSILVCKPKILVLENVISELDYNDALKVVDLLHEYTEDGNIVINYSSDIEESVYGNRIIVLNDGQIAIDGKTSSVLKEEKILKKLGFGLPLELELNRYLIDYGIIKKECSDIEKLVTSIWK